MGKRKRLGEIVVEAGARASVLIDRLRANG
jgi:hypothetical protein